MDSFTLTFPKAQLLKAGAAIGLNVTQQAGPFSEVLPTFKGVSLQVDIAEVDADTIPVSFTVLRKPIFFSIAFIQAKVNSMVSNG
jgi:hypothetical protein